MFIHNVHCSTYSVLYIYTIYIYTVVYTVVHTYNVYILVRDVLWRCLEQYSEYCTATSHASKSNRQPSKILQLQPKKNSNLIYAERILNQKLTNHSFFIRHTTYAHITDIEYSVFPHQVAITYSLETKSLSLQKTDFCNSQSRFCLSKQSDNYIFA